MRDDPHGGEDSEGANDEKKKNAEMEQKKRQVEGEAEEVKVGVRNEPGKGLLKSENEDDRNGDEEGNACQGEGERNFSFFVFDQAPGVDEKTSDDKEKKS